MALSGSALLVAIFADFNCLQYCTDKLRPHLNFMCFYHPAGLRISLEFPTSPPITATLGGTLYMSTPICHRPTGHSLGRHLRWGLALTHPHISPHPQPYWPSPTLTQALSHLHTLRPAFTCMGFRSHAPLPLLPPAAYLVHQVVHIPGQSPHQLVDVVVVVHLLQRVRRERGSHHSPSASPPGCARGGAWMGGNARPAP